MLVLLFVITDTALLSIFGGIVGGLATYIIIRDKAHRKDIKERNELLQTQFKSISEMNETAQDNIKENTNVLSALKTLLEINLSRR